MRGSAHLDTPATPQPRWGEIPATPHLGLTVGQSVSIVRLSVVIYTTDEDQVIWLKALVSSHLSNLAKRKNHDLKPMQMNLHHKK